MADETPLAPGAVYGLRVWPIREGRLVPVSHHGAWEDGVTTAECQRLPSEEPVCPLKPVKPVPPWTLTPEERQLLLEALVGQQRQRDVQVLVVGGSSFSGIIRMMVEGSYDFPETHSGPLNTIPLDLDDDEADALLCADYARRTERYPDEVRIHEIRLQEWVKEMDEWSEKCATHQVPDPECTCGLYLARDLGTLDDYVDPHHPMMIGVVKGYGRTASFEHGWRVEKAEIVAAAAWTPDVDQVIKRQRSKNSYVYQLLVTHRAVCPIVERVPVQDRSDVESSYPSVQFYGTDVALLADWLPRIGEV